MALTKIDDRGLNTPIDLLDNEKIRLGTGNDLEIYHNGSHSYIDNTNGTGNIYIQDEIVRVRAATSFAVDNADGTETALMATLNGAVKLYYNNVKSFETTANGTQFDGTINFTGTGQKIDLTDDQELRIGTGDDLILKHNATDSSIINITGDLLIQCTGDDLNLKAADDVNIKVQGGAENAIIAYGDGAVELYYDNAKKLETTSDGVWVSGHIRAGDDAYLKLGASGDLQIYHDGSNTRIQNATGELQNFADTWRVVSNSGSNENMIRATYDAGVELFYNNGLRFETTSSGAEVPGGYYLRVPHDSGKLQLGAGDDLQIYHNGTHSYVEGSTGNLLLRPKSGEDGVTIIPDGAVKLAYNDSTCLETRADGGVEITDGNLIIGTAGHGIQFDTGDSGSDELLDDYEEGTWTPALSNGPTISSVSGFYTKIGRMCFVSFAFQTSTDGTAAHVWINNLPFSSLGGSDGNGIAWGYRTSAMSIHINPGSDDCYFYHDTGGAMEGSNASFEGKDLRGTLVYYT